MDLLKKKQWQGLLLIFFMIGCASKKSSDFEPDGEVNDIPKWVYSPAEACDRSKFCSSGEGDSFSVSDGRAKKNLAGMFETKVSSSFNVTTSSLESTAEKDSLEERITSEVEETVDEAIKGVEIEERFSKDGVFYSYVSLDKRKFGKDLRTEITKCDDEISYLFDTGKKTAYTKLIYLSEKRYLLNEKYILLTGKSIPTKYSQKEILAFRYVDSKNQYVKIFWDEAIKGKRKLKGLVEELLTESGYKIGDNNNYSYGVYLNVEGQKAFMNVRGFVKFDYKVEVKAKDNMQKEVGSFVINQLVTGRTEQDTWIKARPKLIEGIKKNLHKLNI
jgi:hypothetical protein